MMIVKIFYRILFTALGFLVTFPAASTDTLLIDGSPRIIHYTRKEFSADPQFWTMCQDRNGILYFGNNDGALVFDGERWEKVSLPNNASIRSLMTGSDGVVYAGGFNEFGTIRKDEFGKYHFVSLRDLLRQEDRSFENIWDVTEAQGHIVFRSTGMLIAISGMKATTIPATSYYGFSETLNDTLYVADADGLKSLDLSSLKFTDIASADQFNNEEIIALLPLQEGGMMAVTKQGATYTIDRAHKTTTLGQRLISRNSNNLITCAIRAGNNKYYLGTLDAYLIELDESATGNTGNTFLLQDKTVLNLFESYEGNIWTLLNNGIDCIDMASPMSLLFENASVFDVLQYHGISYLATNQGVFVSNHSRSTNHNGVFEKVDGLEGQAWSLQKFNNTVLCSHDRGVYELTANGPRRISGVSGVWKVIEIDNRPDDYLVCTYNGIYLMHHDAMGGFEVRHRIEGFDESSRDILQMDEPGLFWVCHGYKGVYRIKMNDDYTRVVGLEHFEDHNGLPSPFNINVFRWQGEIVFTTNKGIFTFNAGENRFQPHQFLTRLFGTTLNVRKLLQSGDRTWFCHDDEIGYFLTEESNPQLEKNLFLQLKGALNRGMECIVPLDDQHVLVGTNTGLYAFDLSFIPDRMSETMITGVSYQNDSKEIPCKVESPSQSQLVLPYLTSSIRFRFAAPGFQDRIKTQYSHILEGADEEWSDWDENPYMDYSHLRSGEYVFRVRARSSVGESSSEAAFHFEILPAWHQTGWALTLFTAGTTGILALIMFGIRRKIRIEKNKTRDEEAKKRKVLELEIVRMKLEKEKEQIIRNKDLLEEDVIHKSKVLANYTMLLLKKRELLAEIQEELKQLKDLARNDSVRQKTRALIRRINQNLENEEYLQIFDANFERVHSEFFAHLKTAYPDLTRRELRLCAFVRMNLTNKEIASILNISVRGVETARYRLRKRLSLTHEEDMVEFLEKLHTPEDLTSPERAHSKIPGN